MKDCMKTYIFLIACLLSNQINTEQYIYPVADCDNGDTIITIYQKSAEEIEVWFFDTINGYAQQGLSSFCQPVNIKMMPSGNGFSFIDQGYIKIKEFSKRSAQTLAIYEPIGLFSGMNWIDNENFYFVALQGNFFQIFQGDVQANIVQLTNESADALYPCIIDSTLFYIRRDKNKKCDIVKKDWKNGQSLPKVMVPLDHDQSCFLRMTSDQQGFYIQAKHKKNNEDNYQLTCHCIQNIEDVWADTAIFTLQIPAYYVTGPTKLYESIIPFLPRYTEKQEIYFSTWDQEYATFILKKYNLKTQCLSDLKPITISEHRTKIFAPYVCNNQIYCGFMAHQDSLLKLLQYNDTKITLPNFQIE